LRQMLEKQTVHVQGQIVAAVKMSFLEKLALHTEHPRVLLPLAQDVPVAFSTSPFARQAALGILTVIEFGMQGRVVARKDLPGFESPWVHDLKAQAKTNLLQVETSYELKEHDASYPVVFDQLGFRLASGVAITTAEARSPWEYDPEFLTRIKSGDAKIVKDKVEIQLLPASKGAGDTPLLLSHRDFTMEVRGNADKDKDSLIVQQSQKGQPDQRNDFAKISVRRRASLNALTVVVLHTPPAGGFTIAPAAIVQRDSWEKVAVYRMVPDSNSGKGIIEVVALSARRDGQAIRLDHPVDPSFYGSPIMVPEGVLGIVQDEQAGAFLPADLVAATAVAPTAQ
jgi:hypothetical protein